MLSGRQHELGLIFLFAVYPLMMYLWPSGWRWQPNQPEYEEMILGVYATLGIFLLLASRNPSENRSLIAFTAWSSLVHAAIMAPTPTLPSAPLLVWPRPWSLLSLGAPWAVVRLVRLKCTEILEPVGFQQALRTNNLRLRLLTLSAHCPFAKKSAFSSS